MTGHTTIANYKRLPRYRYQKGLSNYREATPWMQAVPVNEGLIDYGRFLGALCDAGFNGTVAYEMCSPLRDGGALQRLDDYALCFLETLMRFRARSESVVAAR